jgi:hypothetical protein
VRETTEARIRASIEAATTAASRLKEAIVAEKIYVATGVANSSIPYEHLTKAFQVHEAILILCRAGYGSEALALSRTMIEMFITIRWITNQNQVERSEEFAFFVAKRKEYMAKTFLKYQPGSLVGADAVKFVENTYKQYAAKYSSWVFWSNKPNNLKQLAEEKEVLIPGLTPPNDDALMTYELFYSHASDYVHATAMALDEVFPATGEPYTAEGKRQPRHVYEAIIYSTQWLFHIMIRVNTFRQLGLDDVIHYAYVEFSNIFVQ